MFLFATLFSALITEKSPIPTYKPTNKNETLDRPDSNKVQEAVMDIKGDPIKTGGDKDSR